MHSHTGRALTLGWTASAGLPVKRIVTRHVAFQPRHPLIHRLKYTCLCDGIIAVSEAVRRAAMNTGLAGSRIEVIPTGVELPDLPGDVQREAARRAWNLSPSDFAVGHLGAFTREKGQDVAVEALQLLAQRVPGLRMILAGEGPLRSSLPAHPALNLPGHIPDPQTLLAALDLFIMPSRSEGWGLAALEAMAAGLPVIASNTGGLAEMIVPGDTGWLVTPGQAQPLANAIAAAASDRDSLREMGKRGRARAECFSVAETARRTEQFYLRILTRR